MKRIFTFLAITSFAFSGMAQTDSTRRDTIATIKVDTIRIGNIVIVRDNRYGPHNDKTTIFRERSKYKPSNLSTNWCIIDLGFNQVNDQTNYAQSIANGYLPAGANEDWFNQRNFKSTNINFWVFMQRLNMIKHVVNLKYGIGVELNNYKYTENIKYQKTVSPLVIMDNADYRKNKLAADYVTVPMMLNFNFTPDIKNGFGLSVGMSAGYLYSSRQKINGGEESGKKKYRDDYDLRKLKLAYIAELNLGFVRLYGSYATKSMFKRALDQTPVSFGLRLSNL